MLLPLALPLLPTVAADTQSDVRVLAVYSDVGSMPVDAFFIQHGMTPGYRFASIPAIILSGPTSAVQDISPGTTQVLFDEPLYFHLETAVVASKARDVWGTTWHANSGIAPILKDGVPIDGRGVTVGIVDSGVNAMHPDLWYAPFAVAPGVTPAPKVKACVHTTGIVGPVTVPTPDCDENVGHGTHVAGIVAGTGMMADMGFTVSGAAEYNGAAPGAQLAVAGLGVETVALGGLVIDGLAGLDWQYANAEAMGTRVVTNSWSSAGSCTANWNADSDVYHRISNKLVQDKGITVLWAANNDGGSKPIGTSPQGKNTMPGVIMVANYDDKGTGTRDGDIALTSGDGCVMSGGAPSDQIWTWPDVAAPGSNIVSTANGIDGVLGMAPIFVGSTPNDAPFYTTLSGTSMATPHVAGIVALMYQANPDITPAQVESILIKTAKPWTDGVSSRSVTGTAPYWGPAGVNNAVAGFADESQCRVTREIAARAEANDPTLDALFPGFRQMVQPRTVNGLPVDADAANYICRDFKRGAGLVDAEAAVREALRLAGDDTTEEGTPEIKITSPDAGTTVTESQLTVEGLVDRLGEGPNAAPTATLAASVTNGPAPLSVAFSLAAADPDGAIAGFSLDFGDGSAVVTGGTLPAGAQSHSYASDGAYTATLTVTDDEGATGDATVSITVGGLPSTNADITGSIFAYNFIASWPVPPPSPVPNVPCPGASNIIATGTGPAGDDVPKYVPGTSVCVQGRTVVSNDVNVPISTASDVKFRIFDASGASVYGPIAATVTPVLDTVTGAPTGSWTFSIPNFALDASWAGRYYLGFAVDGSYVTDPAYGGLKPIDIGLAVPTAGEPGPADDGHSISDVDNDGATPAGEILWVDTAVDSDWQTTVIALGLVEPQPAGDSPFIYDVYANNVRFEAYILGDHAVFDVTNGAIVEGAETTWDTTSNTITVKLPRAYLASVGADCPCTGHVEAMLGEGQLGGVQTVDRAPNAGEHDLAASWQSLNVPLGSSGAPENSDETGDTPVPHLDVTKAWVSRESATEIDITLAVADLASSPPSVDAGAAKAATNYGMEFCVDNAGATYVGNQNAEYAGVAGVICYRLSATNGPLGVQHSGGNIQSDGSASCGQSGITTAAVFNTAASTITWTVSLAGLSVSTIGATLADCNAAPPAHNARLLTGGDHVTRLAASTGMSAGAVFVGTLNVDSMDPSTATPYTLGGSAPALVAEAGSGYLGGIGDAIAITGSASGGSAPYTCAWSATEGVFTDAAACATSVSFSSAGAKTITLTVTDDEGAIATDSASVNIVGDAFEHVDVVVGGRTVSAGVTTSDASPTATWSALVDLAGLANGPTQITATWYDADGTTVLGTATRTIDVQLDAAQAIVDILTPDANSEVSGVSVVTGIAGHSSGNEGSGGPSGAQLNHYGFPIGSGLNGGRSTVELSGDIAVPCAACKPGQLNKPVAQIPNAAWNPIRNNVEPVVYDNLATSAAWLAGPNSDEQGLDGYWFNIAGHGGDGFELSESNDVLIDIRFYADPADAQADELGGVNGPAMPKTGSIPAGANWAFTYIRTDAEPASAANQWGAAPTLKITPVIVPPGAVQGLVATSGAGTVTLAWAAPVSNGGELLGYKVLRDGVPLTYTESVGYVDMPGDTAAHVYGVLAYNSAGEGPTAAVMASAGQAGTHLTITNPIDGAVGVPSTTTIDGTYSSSGGPRGGDSAFANTHYVALLNLNSPCGNNLGYGDHVIFSKIAGHAVDALGVPSENIHVFNENDVALTSSIDAANYNKLPGDWQSGAAFEGKARWSVFEPALREIADRAADGEENGGAPARIFFLESSHGLQASLALGDGPTDSIFCLEDVDVSSTMLGNLLNSIDSDVADAHDGVQIEWSINIDCSFCGGFVDSPLPAPGVTAVHSAGVVGPNRVVEVGCTWVTECFGNPAVTYDYMFNECVFTGKADGYGPVLTTIQGTGSDGSDVGNEVLVGSATYAEPDGVITLEESYWCALETAHANPTDYIAVQQMFQISDNVQSDMFGLEGFPLWEKDSSLNLADQDPDVALDITQLSLPDTRATDPEADGLTPFSDLVGVDASATATDILVDVGVADLTLSSLAAEDEVQYVVHINDNAFSACYFAGEVTLWGEDIPGEDPVTGEPSAGGTSSGTAVYDTANGVIHFSIPMFELNDMTLPASVYATSTYGDCGFSGLREDDRAPDSGAVMTSDIGDPPVDPGADKIVVSLSGPSSITGDATLNGATSTWSFAPLAGLADGVWTATATLFHDDGTGFAQVGIPKTIGFTVGVPGDITPPSAPSGLATTATSASSIAFSWTASTDNVGVDHYEIVRNGISQGTTSATSFTDTGLAAASTYTYVVKAFDAAGNSASSGAFQATTDPITGTVGTLVLRAGETLLGTADIDLSSADPASWSIDVNWAALPDGPTTIVAEYDDGEGNAASDSILLTVTRGVSIEITSPGPAANVLPTFTVSGTVEGAGGPNGFDSSTYVLSDGRVDKLDPAYMLATTTNVLTTLDAALAGTPGYLGVAPSLAGDLVVNAWFSGAAPAAPQVALPAGWTLAMRENVHLDKAILQYPDNYRVRQGPPTPGQAVGIGPGSHLIMDRPDGTFGCTANFVWKDTNGKYYLGAAGHCFVPADLVGTHGAGADYDRTQTHVEVCVASCQFGGQAGFIITGTMVPLGKVAYARQTAASGDIGNDFGIVEIPQSLYASVHPEMHVWNGPVAEGTLQAGEPVLLYGNSEGFGATWPTMARAGFGSPGQNANIWSAVLPSAPGDSGGALVSARTTDPTATVIEGNEAIGALTHIVLLGVLDAPNPFPIAGTTMSRAKSMALEAGLTIVPVLQGQTIAPPQPTAPSPPTLESSSPAPRKVTLTWTAPTNDGGAPITGYKIRYGTTSGSYTDVKSVGVVASASVTGLSPATQYYFAVAAVNSAGTSANSNELDVATQPLPTPPEAPRNLAAIGDNGKVILGWDAPASDGGSPITSYTVSFVGGPSGSVTKSADERSATITGLTNGIEYTFTVTATNDEGTSPASEPALATPNGAPPADFTVEVRADAAGTEVLGWSAADSFDGSSFAAQISGASPGTLTVTARLLQNGVEVATHSVDVHVVSAPVLTLPASAAGNELELVEFTATAADADGPAGLTYSLVGAPAGASIGAVSGHFTWTPAYGNAGTHYITVRVTDPDGLTDEDVIPVTIGAVNRPPILDAIGNKVVGEGQLLSFTVTASDHENDALTFTTSELPAGAAFDASAQTLTWTPDFGLEGNYPVTFSVTDGVATDDETIVITVGNVDRPPILDEIGAKSVNENALLVFAIGGSDPDVTDGLAFSATGLPAGASFIAGLFAWTPTYAQAGEYTVTFRVTDGELIDSEDVTITVANVDRAPTLAPIGIGSVVQGSTLARDLHAADPDGDVIVWSLNGPATAAVQDLGGGNAKLVWTPGLDELGPSTFTVFATTNELAASQTTVLTAIFKADLTATPQGSTIVHASPGDVLQFTTTVTNMGPHTDTFSIAAGNSGGLAVAGVPGPITLDPGESADVIVTVVASAAKTLTWTTVTATSLGDGTTAKSARFRYDLPVLVSVRVDNVTGDEPAVSDTPTGLVHVTYLNGVKAPGAKVSVTQTATSITPMHSTVTGDTDANGDFAYDLTTTWGGAMPGNHDLFVAAHLVGAFDTIVQSRYVIGADL